jgi:hypothetical protein
MIQNEQIIEKWAPILLLMELDNLLWRESENISIRQLWEYLSSYCYLPRLANEGVLLDAIQTGLNSDEYFAFAAGFDDTRYIDLKFNQYVGIVERSGYLVKVDMAQKQIAEEAAKRREATIHIDKDPTAIIGIGGSEDDKSTHIYPVPGDEAAGSSPIQEVKTEEKPKNTRFYMSAQLDTTRIGRDVQRLVEEVISHLTSVEGAQVELSLDVNVISPKGMSTQTVRTVSENCQTLRVQTFGFEE